MKKRQVIVADRRVLFGGSCQCRHAQNLEVPATAAGMSNPSPSSSSQARPTPVTLVSGYEITHNASNGYERHFRSCTALRLQASWAALNKPHDGVHTFNMAGHDEVKAMERQWKKIAAIRIAAEHALKRDSESLIIWHDGTHPRGEAIERARRIAAEQPDVDVWVGPGDQKLLAFLPKLSTRQSNDDFYGVPIDDVLEMGTTYTSTLRLLFTLA